MKKVRTGVWQSLTRLFLMIAEPRVARIIQFVIYLCMATAGVAILASSPASFRGVIGSVLVAVFGSFLAFGGLAGAVAVLPGIWWLERIGVLSLWTGLGMFVVIALALGVSLVGLLVSIAFSGTLIQRWFEIHKYQLAPRR